MSTLKLLDKKTQTDQVRSKVISLCLFILKNGEFDDVSYKVIKQKRCEESVVITYNNLFGILGENVDPLSISLSSHGICKVLILFRSVQTYNLVKKGSFDAGLFLDILRRYHRKTVFCPGLSKSCIQFTGQGKLKTTLEYYEIPFPRHQTTGCTVYHEKPVGVTDLVLQCNTCSLFTKEVSTNIGYESANISYDAAVFPSSKESTVSVTVDGKYADKNRAKSDYSCLKRLLRRNSKTCLIAVDVVDKDLDGNVTFSLGLSSGHYLEKDNFGIEQSKPLESGDNKMSSVMLNEDHNQSSQEVPNAKKSVNDNSHMLPCNIVPLNHPESRYQVSKSVQVIEKRNHQENEKDTVNDCVEITSSHSESVSNVPVRNISDQSLKIEKISQYKRGVDVIRCQKPNADDCHNDMTANVLEIPENNPSGATNHSANTEQDINNVVNQSNLNFPKHCHTLDFHFSSQKKQSVDYSGRTNKAFGISSLLQNKEKTRDHDSDRLNIDGISQAVKNSFEILYTEDNREIISAPKVSTLMCRQVATCSETSTASERLDDIISQLKKSVLKPKVDHLEQLSESKNKITTAVSQTADTGSSQEIFMESSLLATMIGDNGKRKRTPSKKLLENLECSHKYKCQGLQVSLTKEKASNKSHTVTNDEETPCNVKKLKSPKQKLSQCKASTQSFPESSEGSDIPSSKSNGGVGEVTGIKLLQTEKQEDMMHHSLHNHGNRTGISISTKHTQQERKLNLTGEKIHGTEIDTDAAVCVKSISHAPVVTRCEHDEADLEIDVESIMQLAKQPPTIAAGIQQKMKKNGVPAQCPVCFEFYSSDRTLKRHMRIHSLIRPYSCPVCNKSFVQKITMKVHMRLHSGEKPHQCFICGRSFAQKSNMETHVRRHLGVRPYKCDICSKGFSDKGSLGEHMKTHTGEQPYMCTICGKSFSQRANMRTHLSRHKAEKPYMCTHCGKSFKNKDCFMKHGKHHHSGAGL